MSKDDNYDYGESEETTRERQLEVAVRNRMDRPLGIMIKQLEDLGYKLPEIMRNYRWLKDQPTLTLDEAYKKLEKRWKAKKEEDS